MIVDNISEFEKYLILLSESLLVVVLAITFYLLNTKTKFKNIKWIYRQIIIGVIFGGAAIFGTEMGIDIGTSIINVRDAAPVTAGLIFGGPAGMIAAFIGSLYRMIYSLAFSKGEYAMLACCISTLLAGAYAWVLRKWFFEEKTPNFLFGFATAAIMEVLHFIILYLSHIRDPQTVLDIIYEITAVMIIANGVGVSLACLAIGLIDYGFSITLFKSRERTINSRIQFHLLILILATAFMSTSFVVIIQNNYANETANTALAKNVDDTYSYICEESNETMQNVTINVMGAYEYYTDITDPNERLKYIRDYDEGLYLSTFINIIAFDTEDGHKEGDIIYSSEDSFIGKNILDLAKDGESELSYLHENTKVYEKDEEGIEITHRHAETNIYHSSFYNQNVKVGNFADDTTLGSKYYIQVATEAKRFIGAASHSINFNLKTYTYHRRVYLNGFIIVMDSDGKIVNEIDYDDSGELNITVEELRSYNNENSFTRMSRKIYDRDCYFMYSEGETYFVISVIPTTDVTDGRNMMIIVYSFMLIFIYASIFFVTYILMKQLVIKNLRKINNTLNLIMKGDLDQKVDVKSSQEFIDLSRDINITVDTLKDFIKEAEERIDQELAFARSIQTSSLPSVFPAFPGIKEFDIYATMNTAKEVGGDFYDFYFVDANHFAFLVADVSGKGIPASMFMMESKALIKNTLTSIKDPAVLFERVNNSLCQGNDANMFVTCWMGILDLNTGMVEFVNAGHNAPIIYRKENNKWEYLTSEAKDFVLAGLENTKYHKQSIKLNPGDKIYLYTDGVTEATRGDKTLYGEERLLAYLNKQKTFNQYKLLEGIQKDIDRFVAGGAQFDDITMLIFDFKQTSQN